MKIEEITNQTMENNIVIKGYVFKAEMVKTRAGKHIQSLWVTDYTDSIIVKRFENNSNNSLEELKVIGKGNIWIKVRGEARFDSFAHETVLMAREVEVIKSPASRKDTCEAKRVELHTHSKMSAMDGIGTISQYINAVASWGHKAIAVTDHGNVQSFPEAQMASGKAGIKMIYGVEFNMVDPVLNIVYNPIDTSIEHATYVSFDLETTGLSVIHDGITEFGAVKIRNGEVIDRMQKFINPGKTISSRITNLTSITNDMVKNEPTIDAVLSEIIEFFDDCILVAHNANFDIGFLNENLRRNNLPEITNPVIDSLALARAILKPMKSYRLGNVCRTYRVNYDDEVAHRADYDAQVLGEVFNLMIHQIMQTGKYKLLDLCELTGDDIYKIVYPYHMTALALNKTGLKNMFKLVSEANTKYFHGETRIPKERLEYYREGLLYGSSCYNSDVFEAALNLSDKKLEQAMKFYDYIEIQPIEDYYHLIERGKLQDRDELIKSLHRIVDCAKKLDKLIVATGDVHFLDVKDKIFRDVFISNPTIGIGHKAHPLCDRRNPKAKNPCQYLRTTNEMLKEFDYLGEEKAYEVVVTNTNKIADMCEKIKPISPEKCPPHIPGCEEDIKNIAYQKAHELYGDTLPEIVQTRLDKELNSIISNGYSVMYIIAQKLVWKSNEDGYIVGSRGSVGSSLVAFMTGITEVNSLQPHYRCPKCKYSDFTDYGIGNGFDLPDKTCPKCGEQLAKDGMDIPFETFLGFNGDKEPDIDLNFSGEYQAKAHKYTEVIFGKGTTFKAGTVGTVAEKTAFGYAKNYFEEREIHKPNAEVARVSTGCVGVKRTTGQHPGGIIVVPKGREIFEFTPVQHPADDSGSDIITTHFDYHSIDGNLLKLDILGHDDPTVIRMLQDLTDIAPTDIPLDDQETMSIFNSTKALKVTPEQIHSEVGTYGIPEFGTQFARGMLLDTHPTTFDELIRLSGLSHGTDVWLGNAQTLINDGIVTLKEAICCRDDIMVYLMKRGLPPDKAFKIMETVRKGKALKDPEKWDGFKKVMKEFDIPDWYVKSCEKIKYMFPKAHAAAYVTNAVRIAWFKVHRPLAYYAAYFSIRAKAFDAEFMINGKEKVVAKMKEITSLGNAATPKDKDMYDDLELVNEMYERGFEFLPVDLYKSHSTRFQIEDNKIRPPLNCIAGLGNVAAESIYKARLEEPFECIEDMQARSKIGKSVTELLEKFGCLKGMTKSNQMSLFV